VKGRVSAILLLAACGGRHRQPAHATPVPVPTVMVGDCGRPGTDGVMAEHPDPADAVHADRDLDGDGVDEVVVADRTMCTPEGNCYWNVFVAAREEAADQCQRFAGTLAAAALEPDPGGGRGEDNFADLRGYWRLTSGGRLLLNQYRFRRGGYQVVDAILCRREGDDRLQCEDPDNE
jgi:hypothetical protein